MTVILDPMDLETVSVKIRFATGSRDETPDVYGITHFCEHMLMKGTKNLFNLKFGLDKGYASIAEKRTEKNVPTTEYIIVFL